MAAIELGADKLGPEKSGPEKYAPPDRRAPEKRSDAEHIAFLRQQRGETTPTNESPTENLNGVIQRVAGDSMEEIDRVIRALEGVRDIIRDEGERVSREIAGYASLSHSAATTMKVIADSINQWRDRSHKPSPHGAHAVNRS
jgi:hypothetical protein